MIDLLLHNLRTIGTHHCDGTVGEEAADEIERLRAEVAGLRAALEAIDRECYSHVDGRDLFAQMHPRNTLDIRRRVDARETWFEGDWLTDLWTAIKAARAALAARKGSHADQA